MIGKVIFAAGLLLCGVILAAPVPQADPEPEWMTRFRKVYELKENEYVKRVTKPWIPERIEFELRSYGPANKNPEIEKANRESSKKLENWTTLFIEQEDRKLTLRYALSSAGLADRLKKNNAAPSENLFEVSEAVECITGLSSPEFIVDPKQKGNPLFAEDNRTIQGDFVTRKDAPLDKLAPQLEKILREECKVAVTLRIVEEEQEVYVARGKFKLKPPAWRKTPILDIYATEEGLNKDYDHFDFDKQDAYKGRVKSLQYDGVPSAYFRFLGERLNVRIVWDDHLPSEPKFSWNNHKLDNPTKQEEADDKDPEKVLKHAAEQCGMTFKKERRKVKVLVLGVPEK